MRPKPVNRKAKNLEKALPHLWKVYESCFTNKGKLRKGYEWLVPLINKVQDDIKDIIYQLENGVLSHLATPELMEKFIQGEVKSYEDDWGEN